MKLVKINAIVRFLERSGTIVIDTEGYIVWTRKSEDKSSDYLTLGEVAQISEDVKNMLSGRTDDE